MFGSLLKLKKKQKKQKIDEAVYTSKNGVYKNRPHVSDLLPWVAIDPDCLEDFNFVHGMIFPYSRSSSSEVPIWPAPRMRN